MITCPPKSDTWANDYIGLPFAAEAESPDGHNCWDLVRKIFAEVLNINLPSYAESYRDLEDWSLIEAVIETERRLVGDAPLWVELEPGQERYFDIMLFRIQGREIHIGIVMPERRVLHTLKRNGCLITRYDSTRWRARVVAFGRHRDLVHA